MKITREEVEHVARLARLELRPDEMERITGQLDTLLSYVAKLDEVETTGVAVTTHTRVAGNGFREDAVSPSLPRESALAGAPQQNGESFVVPRILT
jgi:aspartyl-tRNA(Asn)/glutamyl-tRNA(Gln) amidotransferase subunit C